MRDSVALALVEMVGLQDREYHPDFILKVVNSFRRDGTCDLRDGTSLGGKDLVGSILRFARHGAFAFQWLVVVRLVNIY